MTVDVTPVNDAPKIKAAIPDQVAKEDSPFTFQIDPNKVFVDVDGDTMSFAVSGLPKWLSYDD